MCHLCVRPYSKIITIFLRFARPQSFFSFSSFDQFNDNKYTHFHFTDRQVCIVCVCGLCWWRYENVKVLPLSILALGWLLFFRECLARIWNGMSDVGEAHIHIRHIRINKRGQRNIDTHSTIHVVEQWYTCDGWKGKKPEKRERKKRRNSKAQAIHYSRAIIDLIFFGNRFWENYYGVQFVFPWPICVRLWCQYHEWNPISHNSSVDECSRFSYGSDAREYARTALNTNAYFLPSDDWIYILCVCVCVWEMLSRTVYLFLFSRVSSRFRYFNWLSQYLCSVNSK